MQKIDFTQPILDLTEEPISTGLDEHGGKIPLTLRSVCIQAIGDQKNMSVGQKLESTLLAEKIFSNDKPGLTAKEVAMLVELVGKHIDHYLVCTRSIRLLDPPDCVPE